MGLQMDLCVSIEGKHRTEFLHEAEIQGSGYLPDKRPLKMQILPRGSETLLFLAFLPIEKRTHCGTNKQKPGKTAYQKAAAEKTV